MVEIEKHWKDMKSFFTSGQVPLLKGLNDFALGYILFVADIIETVKDEIIIKEGDRTIDYVYIVFEGEIAVVKGDDVIAIDGPGACVGEMISLSVEHHRRATVRVKSDKAELLRIPFECITALRKTLPEEAQKFDDNVMNIMWNRLQQIPR